MSTVVQVSRAALVPRLRPDRLHSLPILLRRRSSSVATIALAALLCAGTAYAQPFNSQALPIGAQDYALIGQQLLAQGRIAEALLALEMALLLNPDLPGVQLDYALALAENGQGSAARSIASQALQRPDVPRALQLALDSVFKRTPKMQLSAYLQMGQGTESNVNNAISAQFLTLQLPNGPVNLPLSDTERPRSASVRKTLVGALASFSVPRGELQIGLNVAYRAPRGEDAFASTSAEASMAYSLPVAGGRLSLQANRQLLLFARDSQFEGSGLQVQYDIQPTAALPCTFSPRMGQVRQHYPNSVLTNGTFRYARLQTTCLHGPVTQPGESQRPAAQTQISIGLGTDAPQDATRPGADRQRHELMLRHERGAPLGLPGELSLWARWHRTQDARPYSPLFGSLVASTHAVGLGAGYWVPVGNRIGLGLELESTLQTSNIGLYGLDNRAIYLGLRWATP